MRTHRATLPHVADVRHRVRVRVVPGAVSFDAGPERRRLGWHRQRTPRIGPGRGDTLSNAPGGLSFAPCCPSNGVAMRRDGYDVVVIGAGLVGGAIAYGLARAGRRVAVPAPAFPRIPRSRVRAGRRGAAAFRPGRNGMPLRGGDGRRNRASDRPRVPGSQPGEGVHPLRHGPVPGPDVRDGGERDVRRATARRRRSDWALRHPPAGQAPDPRRARGAGRNRHDAGGPRQHSDSTEGCAKLRCRGRFASREGSQTLDGSRKTVVFRE